MRTQEQQLISNVCRDFTRATGWPLRFHTDADFKARADQVRHQITSWQSDLRVGHYRAGWLHIDVPTRKSVVSTEFLNICDLADVVTQALTNILSVESIENTEPLLGGGVLAKPLTLKQKLENILDGLLKLTGLRSAGFFLLEPGGSTLRLRVQRHKDGQVIPHHDRSLGESPIDQRVLDQRRVIFRRDEGMPSKWTPSNCKLGIATVVASAGNPVGTLWAFDRRIRRLPPRELDIVDSAAAKIGSVLEKAVSTYESDERQRLNNEISAATGNKPSEIIEVQMGGGSIDIASRCLSCTELGGDMSEVIVEGNDAIIGVGDASGHSLPATIVMSNVRGALYALARDSNASRDSDQLMGRINDALEGVTQSHQFVTMVVGHLKATTREFSFTNAGHPPLILWRNGEIRQLGVDGMLLGVLRGTVYERSYLQLEPGDVVTCYTDGIAEAEDHSGKMFRTEGVIESVKRHAHRSAREIRDGIWRDVEQHVAGVPIEDDRTILVMKVS